MEKLLTEEKRGELRNVILNIYKELRYTSLFWIDNYQVDFDMKREDLNEREKLALILVASLKKIFNEKDDGYYSLFIHKLLKSAKEDVK